MESEKISMETSKRKIAYVITLPDLGGAQSHVYEVMKNIRDYGTEPILITGKNGWLTEQAERIGIRTYIVAHMVREIKPIEDIQAVWDIFRILRQEQPALVHCHSSKAGILGRLAAKLCGIEAIFTAHGWAFTEGISIKKRLVYRAIENMAGYITKRIICVSEYDRQLGMKMLPSHKEKMITVHNCIPDLPGFVRNWEKNPVGEVVHAVVVARFSMQKRNIELLEVLRSVLDAGGKMTITFIGDGPMLPIAKEKVQKLCLCDKVEFLGARKDVATLLPHYDLFILLSNWEGFPISIIEAMRAGLPVFASDVGGVSESVKCGETGVVTSNDKCIDTLLQVWGRKDNLCNMGKAGRRDFLRKYAIRNMMMKLNKLYSDVV